MAGRHALHDSTSCPNCLLVAWLLSCRAPAVPHVASYSDFLLVRLQSGRVALREITGCVAVGQQHPSVPIWAPGSDQAVAYERARFKVRGMQWILAAPWRIRLLALMYCGPWNTILMPARN